MQDSFNVSPDPDLVEKIRDLVGLHVGQPWPWAVFAVDENPQIQALDRTASTLLMLATTPAWATHDYEGNGTCDCSRRWTWPAGPSVAVTEVGGQARQEGRDRQARR
jgi:hypothetical protein